MEEDVKIEELKKSIAEAQENKELYAYSDKMIELWRIYTTIGFKVLNLLDVQSSHKHFDLSAKVASDLCNQLETTLDSLDIQKDEESYREVSEMLGTTKDAHKYSIAFTNYTLGMLFRLNGNNEQAIEAFKKSKKEFKLLYQTTNKGMFDFFSDYSNALQLISEANESFTRGNYGRAKSLFQRTKITLEDILDAIPVYFSSGNTEFTKIPELIFNIKIDCKLCETLYCSSDAKDLFDRGNFSLAREQYAKLCKILSETIGLLPDYYPKPAKNLQLGDFHFFSGSKFLTDGEVFREEGKWDNSLEAYKKTRKEWEKSSTFYLRSGLPKAVAMHETMINLSPTIEIFARQCKREMDLNKKIVELESELNGFKKSLSDAFKQSGVTVNTRAQIESSVEQNVQFNQSIEVGIRRYIKELVEEVKKLPIDNRKKDPIIEKATEVLSSKEKGQKLIERVKSFTTDVANIVKNLGEIAEPILPFIKALSIFFE